VVAAFQAMRGVDFINAVTIAAEVGDLRRVDNLYPFRSNLTGLRWWGCRLRA
jgi:transposase